MADNASDPPALGAYVVDSTRPEPDQSKAVVVRIPDATIWDWAVPDDSIDATVGEYNDEYDPEVDAAVGVAEVVFERTLNRVVGWHACTPESVWPLVLANQLKVYPYPIPDLKQVGTALEPRRTAAGERFIDRLYITGVGEQITYATDYDGVDGGYGQEREVCFHTNTLDVEKHDVVRVEYARERHTDDLPPLLVDISTAHTVQTGATAADLRAAERPSLQ
jgi:hypothetical protein